MGLRTLGLVLILAGVVGAVAAFMAGPNISPLFFAIESGLALTAGLTCLAIGGLRHGYHVVAPGAPPGDMDMSQATDPEPPLPQA